MRTLFEDFWLFANIRELSPFECTPSILNLYILFEAQKGRSVSFFEKFLSAWSFMCRFFLCPDYTKDAVVGDLKKFVAKACPRPSNKKLPFGADEVRKIWDGIDAAGGLEKLDLKMLRTFMIAVFQHKTFCRFAEVKNIQLGDLFHTVDYFKIHVKYSKTDQGGKGQWLYLPKLNSEYRDPHPCRLLFWMFLDLGRQYVLCLNHSSRNFLFPLPFALEILTLLKYPHTRS